MHLGLRGKNWKNHSNTSKICNSPVYHIGAGENYFLKAEHIRLNSCKQNPKKTYFIYFVASFNWNLFQNHMIFV